MKRMAHILLWAVLLSVLSVSSCRRYPLTPEAEPASPELMVSLYIPGATMTRAETGMVNPLQEELLLTSLQIWAFLSEDGTLISYKRFDSDLENTGIPNSTITRFGMPLSDEMFARLTAAERPKVDVYAVANAASAVSTVPDENTTRDALDQLVITRIGGVSPLTMSVPSAGLPLSGVLKGADVIGGYPVLNITTLKLTRAVSKIRFVFCQQGLPASGNTPATPGNANCQIVSVSFDGSQSGNDCQIGASERLFTTASFDLGPDPVYEPLTASITGQSGAPLIANSQLSIVEDPESLFFRSAGNVSETAEHYENRLDAAISRDSQVGPIYLCETDKIISGTITYRTAEDGPDLRARFSMETVDVFSRNHTWIVYACFVEETMTLRLNLVVLPWEWEAFPIDFATGSVNVVRRFTVFETTPPTFLKTWADGFYDITFWHTVTLSEEGPRENLITGNIIIATPVGGILHIIPVPGTLGDVLIPDAISVEPSEMVIYPNYQEPDNPNGRIEHCQIPVFIRCNREGHTDAQLEGNYVDLHFAVETPDGRYVDLGSESIDYYRFILSSSWNQ